MNESIPINTLSYSWKDLTISPCETHHLLEGIPCYRKRFEKVLKFHEPGYAPVIDSTGSYHIDISGAPLYIHRFLKTFGFYGGYAAVATEAGYFHIMPNGNAAYDDRFAWCGNFQETLCAVRDQDGNYFHINGHGERPYASSYCYVGDFKDGIAVVCREDGKSSHIDTQGRLIHSQWYPHLDIFHKRFAKAKDERGWFHVGKDGKPAYSKRFVALEPFYNGQAHTEDFEGNLLVINEQGETLRELFKPSHSLVGALSGDLVGFWKSEAIGLAVELNILDYLPGTLKDIGSKTQIPLSNLERVLRALWEVGIVGKQKDLWVLTEKGSLLTPTKESFMAAASLMWPKVQETWRGLNDKVIAKESFHHPTFKEETADSLSLEIYRRALKGYALEDFKEIAAWDLWGEHQNILGLGQTAITFLEYVLTEHPLLRGIILNEDRPLYHVELDNSVKPRLQQVFADIDKPGNIKADAVILPRFLHYFPDEEAKQILCNLAKILPNQGKIYIFEMAIDPSEPQGGLLDLNMLAESGGRLRTWDQWEHLLATANFGIERRQELKPHLHLIIGKKG